MSQYIYHVTLTTGHTRRSPRAEVADEAIAMVRPWMDSLLGGARRPLPAPPLCHYSASGTAEDGGLLLTVWGPNGKHKAGKPYAGPVVPIVAIGVAPRSRAGGDLWARMLANFPHPPGLAQPGTPWCAVAIHEAILQFPDAIEWLGDFERVVAWSVLLKPKWRKINLHSTRCVL